MSLDNDPMQRTSPWELAVAPPPQRVQRLGALWLEDAKVGPRDLTGR